MNRGIMHGRIGVVESNRWVVFAIAWDPARVARADASLARIRDWLTGTGITGWALVAKDRAEVRTRAMGEGLTSQEAWLVSDLLLSEKRGLRPPGRRVRERAREVAMAAAGASEEASRGQGSGRGLGRALAAAVARSGASAGVVAAVEAGQVEVDLSAAAVGAYAHEHPWGVTSAVEDQPWGGGQDRAGLAALPATWLGLVADPVRLGVGITQWQRGMWRFNRERPDWADDPALRSRVLVLTRALGWSGIPLGADLDDVEGYLPQRETIGWLVPGATGVGWCWAWPVPGQGSGQGQKTPRV